ncbi:hypothetical protein DESPIG_01275 [Desulfovibrio piger ATCC 29098]|uniref:Uncharacterized protein n=1 Tax=Desulfovibrio piger ATCC 29098 TaxID=411464 RepID=B6WT70_9BACT|nr:hypothetical protein DESPIG_01275 [Desulfovibrio piger ATCC 29098]
MLGWDGMVCSLASLLLFLDIFLLLAVYAVSQVPIMHGDEV